VISPSDDIGTFSQCAEKKRNLDDGDSRVDFSDFESRYKGLSEKLVPQV
jgi:hypothetical protein